MEMNGQKFCFTTYMTGVTNAMLVLLWFVVLFQGYVCMFQYSDNRILLYFMALSDFI